MAGGTLIAASKSAKCPGASPLSTWHKDVPTIKPTTKARGGVTGHNVRYVLAFGLGGVIIAFLIIALYFYGVKF